MTDSLCCTCGRAYSLPDPIGCSFHRCDIKQLKSDDIPFVEARIKTVEALNNGEPFFYDIYIVTKCNDYRVSTCKPAINWRVK